MLVQSELSSGGVLISIPDDHGKGAWAACTPKLNVTHPRHSHTFNNIHTFFTPLRVNVFECFECFECCECVGCA